MQMHAALSTLTVPEQGGTPRSVFGSLYWHEQKQTIWHVTAVSVCLWACEVVYQWQNTNNFTGLLICILCSWCYVMTQKAVSCIIVPKKNCCTFDIEIYWMMGQKWLNWHVWNSSGAHSSSITGTTVLDVTFPSPFDKDLIYLFVYLFSRFGVLSLKLSS